MKSWITLLSCFAAISSLAEAQTITPAVEKPTPVESSPGEKDEGLSDSSLNIRGVFNSDLPGIGRSHELKLILHPHIGDFSKYSHLRTSVGLRYNISSHLEVSASTNAYFSTGLRKVGFFKEAGFADAGLGFKYRFGRDLLPGWESGVGARYTTPIGSPPPRIIDGFKHFQPFITFARPIETIPDLRVFWKLGFDLLTPTDITGRHDKNAFTDDSNSVGAGFVWRHGNTYYTLEAEYATTRLLSKVGEDVYTIRPGFVWEVPRRLTPNSRSKWLIGIALTLEEGPDGLDVGIGGKLKIDIDFKHLLRGDRNR